MKTIYLSSLVPFKTKTFTNSITWNVNSIFWNSRPSNPHNVIVTSSIFHFTRGPTNFIKVFRFQCFTAGRRRRFAAGPRHHFFPLIWQGNSIKLVQLSALLDATKPDNSRPRWGQIYSPPSFGRCNFYTSCHGLYPPESIPSRTIGSWRENVAESLSRNISKTCMWSVFVFEIWWHLSVYFWLRYLYSMLLNLFCHDSVCASFSCVVQNFHLNVNLTTSQHNIDKGRQFCYRQKRYWCSRL